MSDGFTTVIPVRYSDIDTYGHVNNATYATYLEEARIDYLESLLGGEDLTSSVDSGLDDESVMGDEKAEEKEDAIGMVVANLEIDFLRSIETADSVSVTVGIANVGRSSFTLEYEIHSEDGTHATATTTMVAFDRGARESRPLPDRWRDAIDTFNGADDSE